MLLNGPDNPQNVALPVEDLYPYLAHGSLDLHESARKRHLDRFSCFAYTAPRRPMLLNGLGSPKIVHSPWGSEPHLILSSLGPP